VPKLVESSLEELIRVGSVPDPDKARRRLRLGYPAWFVLGDLYTKEVPDVLPPSVREGERDEQLTATSNRGITEAHTPDYLTNDSGFPEEASKLGRQAVVAPRLARGTELIGEYEGSGFKEPVYLMRRSDGQVIQASRLLYLVAAEADGQKDFGEIASRVSLKFGREVSADNVRFLVEQKLRPLGVLAAINGANPQLERAAPALALKFRVPILPESVVWALTTVFWPLFFAPVIVVVLAGLLAFDYWLFFVHGLAQSITETLHQPGLLLAGFATAFLSGLLHECGHAGACRYSGARPGVIGMGIYLVYPVFYNDVTDSYRLGRVGRLRTDLGGVYLNIILSLAMAGAYFLTGFEPLLLVAFMEQVVILEQFLPFVRLDGYYVISDLTGIPDLFARIKPTLKSMIPGRGMDERVREMKPWVRVVVAAWVVATIPALLCLFGMMVANTPFILAITWDSFLALYDEGSDALRDGRVVDGVEALLQIVLLVIPVAGMALLYWILGKKLGKAVWNRAKVKPVLRPGIAVAAVVAVGVAFLVWRPNDDYQSVQSVEPGVSFGSPEIVHEGSAFIEPVSTNKPTRPTSTSNAPEARPEPITEAGSLYLPDEPEPITEAGSAYLLDEVTAAEEPMVAAEPTVIEEPAAAEEPMVAEESMVAEEPTVAAEPTAAPGTRDAGRKGPDKKGHDKKGSHRGVRSDGNPCVGPDGKEPVTCKNKSE
jgi:putative peptide zinc metalloprotease protein